MAVTGSMTPDQALERLRSLCVMLPEVAEVDLLGNPTFRVATQAFAAFEDHGGRHVIVVKLSIEDQAAIVDGERFVEAPETGPYGWTAARIDRPIDWEHLDELVVTSYRLVAPAHCVAELDERLA